ncbi:hypothetical protein FK220_018060 [Flavobacteriaceae bacterium TP-CH-4]|uniref:Amidohydrolase family protein n=1 Tax=Pelagihabitans pacificus TaxID=2696054 RepID=A0A967EFC3_9FLAO|nr:hypothetical protein [Pelagihabitans pacificus]NHF61263.1 hypothetical protein [Pelagihabitans pacificus]
MHLSKLVKSELLRLHKAGATILAGNDTPNFGINYGDDLHKEPLIYNEARTSNPEVLKSATGNPSGIFQLKDIGKIEVGLFANMLLFEGNPLEYPTSLKRGKHIWKNGEIIK